MLSPKAIAAAAALVAGLAAAAARADDLDRMQGTWNITAAEVAGNEFHLPDDAVLVFSGNVVTTRHGDREVEVSQIAIDPAARPRQIDITSQREKQRGIYTFEEDGTLKICSAVDEAPRPAEFSTGSQAGRILLVLKKQAGGD